MPSRPFCWSPQSTAGNSAVATTRPQRTNRGNSPVPADPARLAEICAAAPWHAPLEVQETSDVELCGEFPLLYHPSQHEAALAAREQTQGVIHRGPGDPRTIHSATGQPLRPGSVVVGAITLKPKRKNKRGRYSWQRTEARQERGQIRRHLRISLDKHICTVSADQLEDIVRRDLEQEKVFPNHQDQNQQLESLEQYQKDFLRIKLQVEAEKLSAKSAPSKTAGTTAVKSPAFSEDSEELEVKVVSAASSTAARAVEVEDSEDSESSSESSEDKDSATLRADPTKTGILRLPGVPEHASKSKASTLINIPKEEVQTAGSPAEAETQSAGGSADSDQDIAQVDICVVDSVAAKLFSAVEVEFRPEAGSPASELIEQDISVEAGDSAETTQGAEIQVAGCTAAEISLPVTPIYTVEAGASPTSPAFEPGVY